MFRGNPNRAQQRTAPAGDAHDELDEQVATPIVVETELTGTAAPTVANPGEAAAQPTELTEASEAEARRQREQQNSEAAAKKGGATLKDPKEAKRRLMRDLRSLQQSLAAPSGAALGMSAHLVDGDIFHWHAVIAGPSDTPWEGGLFKLDLNFTSEYPMAPPHVRFLTKNVFHPNVYVDGNICVDTLKSCWSPSLDVEGLLLSIMSLLSDPNPMSAANGLAARVLTENRQMYDERICRLVEETLEQSFSGMDDEEDEEEDEGNATDKK